MENKKESAIPPIFKFSWLCNIFPYYGSLPKWMLIMKRLNSETSRIWNENKDAFIIVGKDFRNDQTIYVLDKAIKSNGFDEKIKFYNRFKFYKPYLHLFKNSILFLIQIGNKIILEAERTSISGFLKIQEENIIKTEYDSQFDEDKKLFEENDSLMWNYILNLIMKCDAMINKEDDKVWIRSIPSPDIYLHTMFWKENTKKIEEIL